MKVKERSLGYSRGGRSIVVYFYTFDFEII